MAAASDAGDAVTLNTLGFEVEAGDVVKLVLQFLHEQGLSNTAVVQVKGPRGVVVQQHAKALYHPAKFEAAEPSPGCIRAAHTRSGAARGRQSAPSSMHMPPRWNAFTR